MKTTDEIIADIEGEMKEALRNYVFKILNSEQGALEVATIIRQYLAKIFGRKYRVNVEVIYDKKIQVMNTSIEVIPYNAL